MKAFKCFIIGLFKILILPLVIIFMAIFFIFITLIKMGGGKDNLSKNSSFLEWYFNEKINR